MRTYPASDDLLRRAGTTAATTALRGGRLVLAPADFHYAAVADAFSATGVTELRRVRELSPGSAIPVFIDRWATVHAVFRTVTPTVETLIRAFWPGPLTLVGSPQPSLAWDAGSAKAVAVRMPMHPWVLDLIAEIGPLAATGAQAPGRPPPSRLAECSAESIAVGLDGGELPGGPASTVLDVRGPTPVVVRPGAVPEPEIWAALAP